MGRRSARALVAALLIAGLVLLPLAVQWLRGRTALPVDTARVRELRLSPSVLASGVLAYTSQVTLMPQMLGRVQAIAVAEGQQVRAGDPTVSLDAIDAEAEVAQFRAAVNQARLDVQRDDREAQFRSVRAERYRALRAQGMVTVAQYDEFAHAFEAAHVQLQGSRQALLRARAQLAQAQEALARTDIRSPIDGQVTAIETRVGETVVPSVSNVAGSALVTISNPSDMLAEVDVDETDIAAIAVGQPAKVFVASDPDRPLVATVQRLAVMPTALPRGRVYRVRLKLSSTSLSGFHPGMGCRAEVFTGRAQPVLAVPQQAVVTPDGEHLAGSAVVFVVADGFVHRREVTTGQSDDADVELRSGATRGQLVVTGPAATLHRLRDGDRVEPQAPAT